MGPCTSTNRCEQARCTALDQTARANERVGLRAEPSIDPDDDRLTFTWWHYTDADTCAPVVDVSTAQRGSVASLVIPDEPGKVIHMIFEVTD